MSKKTLIAKNRYLGNKATARKMRVRSLASSTAIETREPIEKIEARLIHKRPSQRRVTLA